jgi:hypothetical protein
MPICLIHPFCRDRFCHSRRLPLACEIIKRCLQGKENPIDLQGVRGRVLRIGHVGNEKSADLSLSEANFGSSSFYTLVGHLWRERSHFFSFLNYILYHHNEKRFMCWTGIFRFLRAALCLQLLDMKPSRRSPRFRKKATSDVPRNSSSQCSKVVSDSVEVNENFRPLLWQTDIQELSDNEISFPIPQPALSTASHVQHPKSDDAPRGISRIVISANWKVAFRR